MKSDYKNIEELFKNSLDGYKVEPSKGVWNNINLRLNLKDFFIPNFKTFNIYYLSVITGIFISLVILIPKDSKLINKISTADGISVKTEKTEYQIEIKEEKANNATQTKKIVSYLSEVYTQKDFKEAKERQKSNILPLPLKNNLNEFSKIYGDSLNMGSITVLPPKPLFTVENKAGCAPFEIVLNNQTQSAQYYEWTFGDGSKSTRYNPSYIYQYPGVYAIKLKAIGVGGIAYCIMDSITVYDNPKNKINWSSTSEIIEGQRLEFNSESQNCTRYEWNFGDGTISNLKKADHSYQLPGKYSIVLKSWSEKNCKDSLLVANITVNKIESLIAFPNAFYPNPNGPSSGKYTNREIHNDIFHPLVNEPIDEYELKIYTKDGLLVYQTKDVSLGWDGYFRNQRMPEGVYPYLAKGKFEGGRDFMKRGNVTILYK